MVGSDSRGTERCSLQQLLGHTLSR